MSSRADTVGIVGAGTFGTALASVLARANRRVVLWSRDQAIVDEIVQTRRNSRLPGAALPVPLVATSDARTLATEARFLVLSVASTDVRARAKELGEFLDGSHIVVHAIGALATPTNERVSEVMALGLPTLKLGVIAGPALPMDLAEGTFSSIVAASVFDEVVKEARRLLNVPPVLRVYGSHDLAGVELASALSGAYTIALGLCDGLSLGAGPRAVLITRAVAEAARLGVALGAERSTFAGLAGLGNLLVRSAGDRSTDYTLGRRLAKGTLAADASPTEGARAAMAGHELAQQRGIHMPLLKALADILSGRVEPKDAARVAAEAVASEE